MEVHPPVLAAALHQLGLLPVEDLPMLAAHWLVTGAGGPHTADLAGRSRADPDLRALWPLSLAEFRVHLPLVGVRRTAMGWVTRQVTAGSRTVAWWVHVLNPVDWGEVDPDQQVDDLVYTLDDLQEWAVPIAAGATWCRDAPVDAERRQRAEYAVQQMHVALAAMSAGDLASAESALGPPGGSHP